jgi:hypothetical protein
MGRHSSAGTADDAVVVSAPAASPVRVARRRAQGPIRSSGTAAAAARPARPQRAAAARWATLRVAAFTAPLGLVLGPLALPANAAVLDAPPAASPAPGQQLTTSDVAGPAVDRDGYTVVVPPPPPPAATDPAADAATPTGPVAGNDPASAKAIAAQMVAARGWGDEQCSCLVSLWNKESGWRVAAANPSGAYGIPQSYPGSKMASAGADWQTSAATQITWGLNYISGRYGAPCVAWSTSQAQNSY